MAEDDAWSDGIDLAAAIALIAKAVGHDEAVAAFRDHASRGAIKTRAKRVSTSMGGKLPESYLNIGLPPDFWDRCKIDVRRNSATAGEHYEDRDAGFLMEGAFIHQALGIEARASDVSLLFSQNKRGPKSQEERVLVAMRGVPPHEIIGEKQSSLATRFNTNRNVIRAVFSKLFGSKYADSSKKPESEKLGQTRTRKK